MKNKFINKQSGGRCVIEHIYAQGRTIQYNIIYGIHSYTYDGGLILTYDGIYTYDGLYTYDGIYITFIQSKYSKSNDQLKLSKINLKFQGSLDRQFNKILFLQYFILTNNIIYI